MKKIIIAIILILLVIISFPAVRYAKIFLKLADTNNQIRTDETLKEIEKDIESSSPKINNVSVTYYESLEKICVDVRLNYMFSYEYGQAVLEIIDIVKNSISKYEKSLDIFEITLPFLNSRKTIWWSSLDFRTGSLFDEYNKKRMTIPRDISLEDLVKLYSIENKELFEKPIEVTTVNLDDIPKKEKYLGSKYNPLPIGEKGIFDADNDLYFKIELTLSEVIRGDEAFEFIKADREKSNKETQMPPKGKEYMVAKFKFKKLKIYGVMLYIHNLQFTFYTESGIDYEQTDFLCHNNNVSVLSKIDNEVYVDCLVDVGDIPTIVYFDGLKNSPWFSTEKSDS